MTQIHHYLLSQKDLSFAFDVSNEFADPFLLFVDPSLLLASLFFACFIFLT